MKCPACDQGFSFDELIDEDVYDFNDKKRLVTANCPTCEVLIILLGTDDDDFEEMKVLYPAVNCVLPPEVPSKYAEEFREAKAVLNISSKASAALSRRLLQLLLRDECKIAKPNLYQEIDEFLHSPGVPSYLTDALDSVRIIGNLAAHPTKNTNTGEIVPVEEHEAEWLLETIECLFDYLFVQPLRLKQRKERLQQKLENK